MTTLPTPAEASLQHLQASLRLVLAVTLVALALAVLVLVIPPAGIAEVAYWSAGIGLMARLILSADNE